MKYRRLGSTGLRVSVVGMGTWQFGGEWGKQFAQDEVDAMFDKARQLGITLIDTAECYGDHSSEAFIGNAVGRDRSNWIIATKIGHKFHGPFNRTDDRTAAGARKQLEESLAALKTDYVDILQYHSIPDVEFENAELQEQMKRFVKEGKVRHLGNSIGSNDNLRQTDASQPAAVQVIQVIYNRLDRTPEQRVFASCQRQDLGVLARVPLASGFLSGKYQPGATFPPGDVRHSWKDPKLDDKLREVERIKQAEVPAGVNMAEWALAWCLQHPAVTCVIPGCKSVEQVASNARAADLNIMRHDHPEA
ncbi:MAG TPA: aldo/keto reductase [Tepidisphaeraceae bacterium]|jgi:aryl-alcohol dehydrogenase-like predicted oxidoreductase